MYFFFGLAYLLFAGYGFTGLLFRNRSGLPRYLVLINGYALSIVIFSEAFVVFRSASMAFWTVILISLAFDAGYLLTKKRIHAKILPVDLKNPRGKAVLTAHASTYVIGMAVILLVGWSFFTVGWNGYWGSANEDIFNGLYGRDALLLGSSDEVQRFLEPHTLYQYSSLAFWSILFQSFGRMNVFFLQSLLMIFLQFLGTYFLCRSGFLFSHRLSLATSVLVNCSSFYLSTYFSGHEGSIIFGAMIPFFLGACLFCLHARRLPLPVVAVLMLWLCTIYRTYVFPLGYILVPLAFYALYILVFRRQEITRHVNDLLTRLSRLRVFGTSLNLSWLVIGSLSIAVCIGLYFTANNAWELLEPIRTRALSRYRSWGIAHYKEMSLIYWGILPASLPYGSFVSRATFNQPILINAGYMLVALYSIAVVVGLTQLLRLKRQVAIFFQLFLSCWIVFFLFMKFVVVDSYYLYKFLYTNYSLAAVVFAFSLTVLFNKKQSDRPSLPRRLGKIALASLVILYLISNTVYLTIYGFNVASRPYNTMSSDYLDVDGLRELARAGIYFNLPRYDYQDLVRYVFHQADMREPEQVDRTYEYELKVRGLDDIIYTGLDSTMRSIVWRNKVYTVERAKQTNRIHLLTSYHVERRSHIYNGYPFRWVKDRVELALFNLANGPHTLRLCVEPGPGLHFRPFYLLAYLNEKLIDSIYVGGLMSARVQLPLLDEGDNLLTLTIRERGRNFMPWEERYLNYRIALLGFENDRYRAHALRIMASKVDIVPKETWEVLMQEESSIEGTSDLLCIWDNWGSVEEQHGKQFRWVNNDAELLLLNPTNEKHFLHLELEKGPAIESDSMKLAIMLNSNVIEKLHLTAHQQVKIRLPIMARKENTIKLHLDHLGLPQGDDPRILDFRVFRVFLSDR